MTLIIGVSGRARHGKTEACLAIAGHVNGYDYTGKVADGPARLYDIGDLIRKYCIETGRLPDVERVDMTRDQLQILIDVGKEMRAINLNFWLEQVLKQIAFDDPDVALIPNLRLAREAELIRLSGGYVVRLQRLNEDGSTFISDDRPANDITETNLEFWPADFYITQKNGHAGLTAEFAISLYEYLRGLHE